uniref:Radial spoke head 3 n=1 Tax=Amazona collaria TaxID=241587 RepID=A0A8B9J3D8_9PSIT
MPRPRGSEVAAVPAVLYSYCSLPRTLPARPKYRPPLDAAPVRYTNLMYDPRVVRGNTYALEVIPVLFDFDIEVKPILEVLIGKTVEQALLEVMEEEELAQLWAHQRAYAELRNAELAEVQRLEEQDRRYREEKERRRRQHMQMLKKQKETAEKIAAQAFAKHYLADLIPSVFNNLREGGFFYDPIERVIFISLEHYRVSHLCLPFKGASFRNHYSSEDSAPGP